ncbi:MAG: CGNR zinc finger domain-containing protein [Candidatus Eremiobacteraeota bacterium]|nr:CGNR zinc finger domain-containing protein [Candidatus Eremiobacteraeota bacterium]
MAEATDTAQQSGESKPAPGELALVQSFINTLDPRPGREELSSAAALKAWLIDRGLMNRTERISENDLRHAKDVREALRDLLSADAEHALKPASAQTLSRAARGAQLLVQFKPDGSATFAPVASGVDEAMGRLLAITTLAMLDGSWQRLKICGDDTCRWAFFDYSKNYSRNWCSMASCGNRDKARRFRERQKPKARSARARGR